MPVFEQDQILAFIRDRYPQAEIEATDDIFGLGFVNSLFAMELVMFVEKTFGVVIPNDELRIENFQTAAVMAELVGRLASATSSATAGAGI
jgi:acyl carrier protein